MGTHPIFESDFDCLTDGIEHTREPTIQSEKKRKISEKKQENEPKWGRRRISR